MENRTSGSSRVVSPLQFSSIANGLDLGSTNLFPSLTSVEDSTVTAMDTLPPHRGTSEDRNPGLLDDKDIKFLIDCTKEEIVAMSTGYRKELLTAGVVLPLRTPCCTCAPTIILRRQHGPMNINDICARIQQQGYNISSAVFRGSLESILRKESAENPVDAKKDQVQEQSFIRPDDGTVKEDTIQSSQKPGHRRIVGREANEMKYQIKYRRLKRHVKRLIFENAAIVDEIAMTDAKFQRAKLERKYLLKQLLEYQAMCQEPTQPAVKVVLPPPEVLAPPPPVSPVPASEPPAKSKPTKVRAKKAPSGKAKKEPDSSASTKAAPEEKKVSEAPVAPTDGKTEPPVKPKRKKPGTAIKRRVQPIPVDPKGKPVFPIVLGGLTVHSLGDIVYDRPGFHSERYIWPVGFCSSRYYPSMKTPDKKCIYTCKILDGGYGPTFVMSPEDDSENSIEASSATACHCVVLKAINKARGKEATNTGSGPEFFGFSHPTIQYLLQSLPNARKCSKYQWVKFELPKGKNTGKLGYSVVPADESMDPSDQQDRSSSSFDAERIFKGETMTASSPGSMTLTNAGSGISQLPSPGFEGGMLGYQLKSTSGDPSLDAGTPISPPQSSLSSPLQFSPKISTNTMSPSATSQPTFLIPPSSPLFNFDDTGLPD